MDEEERKLQIKLAKLQADIQIWLTYCFGIIAVFIALTLTAWQLYYSTPDTQPLLKNSFLSTMLGGFAGMIVLAWISAKQMQSKRDEMDKL